MYNKYICISLRCHLCPVSSVQYSVASVSYQKHVFQYPLLQWMYAKSIMLCSVYPLKELQFRGVENVEAGQSISGSENRCLLPALALHYYPTCNTTAQCPSLSNTGQHWLTLLASHLIYQQDLYPPLSLPFTCWPTNQPTKTLWNPKNMINSQLFLPPGLCLLRRNFPYWGGISLIWTRIFLILRGNFPNELSKFS